MKIFTSSVRNMDIFLKAIQPSTSKAHVFVGDPRVDGSDHFGISKRYPSTNRNHHHLNLDSNTAKNSGETLG